MKKQLSILVLSVFLGASAMATAHPLSDMGHKKVRQNKPSIFEQLPGLTEDQKTAIKELHAQRQALRKEPSRGNKVEDLDSTAGDYLEQVEALAAAAADHARARVIRRADKHAQLQAILTTEQLQVLKDFRGKRLERGIKNGKQCAKSTEL